ncbi:MULTISPECIES: DNA methyltransferase [unclassified Streptomyces]|uniref:DNA methyltransferase n=1 Tax=unclassified Streptomyces TaxID=2593676 RepID=UPI002E30BA47|nr:DNA methyltransferase [Streptomyces sp. NBC_01708]
MTLGASSSTGNAVVTLDKSEIRQRARRFAAAWAGTVSEHADKQPFWDAFFQVFGVERRQVAIYERIAKRASTGRRGWLDLLVPGEMGVEQKSAGKSLDTAMDQLIDYLPSLPPAEHPWLLIVSDFNNFKWHNLESGTSGKFALQDLPNNLELFWWLAGYQVPHRDYGDEVAANLAATQLLADVYDALASSGYPMGDSREWITRLLFCLFADDAGVWDRRAFQSYLALHTATDGHDLGDVISRIHRVLNSAPDARPGNLDEDLRQFTYINGDLFAHDLWPMTGNAEVRRVILEACSFDWSIISPAIFGSLFQNVMTPKERRQLGAHYTTERDILRTIRPLFLDELDSELESTSTLPKLRAFHDRLANLKFFDPACGCGNFLVISYREIRRLETTCLRKIAEKERSTSTGQRAADISLLCKVTVDQFYGIELEEFPARIARTALYLMDHLENRRVSVEFGEHFTRFPIPATVNIGIGNALRENWQAVLPANECDYVFGNPPFAGQKTRVADQTSDLKHVWGASYSRWLDYVTGWYRLTAEYIAGTHARAAFVSTNSVTQGEQIARVWRFMLDKGMKIDFAHRTFKWISEARGKAIVHVVIVGFSSRERQTRRLIYSYPSPSGEPVVEQVSHVNPYLLAAPDILVEAVNSPLSPSLTPIQYGNKPSDGGHLVVKKQDMPADNDPATRYLRPYLGAQELLHAEQRWCIWMEAPDAEAVRQSLWLRNRITSVQQFREKSSAADTRKQAATPWRFFRTPQPTSTYIAIPRHVSHTRQWFTVAFENPQVIASDALFTATDPDGLLFAVLSSSMFTAWLGSVGGQLKSDFRFSGAVVYNTFPLPQLTNQQREDVIAAGMGVIAAREGHPNTPLADLYGPLSTPSDIQAAHRTLDRVVDRIFAPRSRPSSVTDRMNILFPAYETMVGHLTRAEPVGRRRRAPRT